MHLRCDNYVVIPLGTVHLCHSLQTPVFRALPIDFPKCQVDCQPFSGAIGLDTGAQNYNASFKFKATLVEVANVDSIFYR